MNKKLLHTLLMFGFIILGTSSCERDDICADATPTTPHLIIRFYDINDPDEFKAVRELTVRGLDENGVELPDIPVNSPFDSIILPLRFQAAGLPTTSSFILEKDSDFFENGDPATDSNKDTINITYTPEFQYVSRACGYKSIFNDVSIFIEQDGNNWILTNQIINTTIDNETSAHIILRH